MIVRPFFFSLLLALAASAVALEVPPLRGRVNDLAGLIPTDRAQGLENRLRRFEEETGHQIAILTIPSLEGEDLEGYSIKVAESWKIGQKGFDNGAILLVAPNDRKLRIEVGYGLEGVLPDALASRIIREVIVPKFRDNDYAGGIEAGVEAIMKVTRGEALPSSARSRGGENYSLVIQAVFLTGLIALFLGGLSGGGARHLSPSLLRGGGAGAAVGVGAGILMIGYGLGSALLMLLVGAGVGAAGALAGGTGSGTWSGGRRGWSTGWWGGSFGGSGGGGFGGGGDFGGGGGGFGGGGASGSW